MIRIFALLTLVLGLSACAGESVWATDEEVQRAHYASSGPATITLFTVINVNSGNGGHAGLMISAPSERVLFDPAGTFHHPRLPERNDVVHGMTDAAVDFYIDYHSRTSWRVVRQDLVVPPAVAEQALRVAKEYGAVPKAHCANALSKVLQSLPGFESIKVTMFPTTLEAKFGAFQGVVRSEYHDMDTDNNGSLLARGI
jgi:hypothetical protein